MAEFLFQPTPHLDAAKLIADKPAVVRSVFDELLPELKGRAFTITGVEVANVLQSVRDRLADLPQGGDWHTIKNDIANEVSPFLDDTTKTAVENRAAAEARAELLLRVHGFQAYSACNERIIERQKDVFPFCEYVTVGDGHVRASHAALDGKIIPTNSDFWKTHTPPWGWGCRCQKVPRTAADVGAIQKKEAKLPPENQNVFTGARLTRLEQGHLELGPSSSISIALPTGPGAFVSTPADLRIPLAELKSRYDAPVWQQFERFAKRTEITELGTSVWAWLNETSTASIASTAAVVAPTTAVGVVTAPAALSAADQLKAKLTTAGLTPSVVAAAAQIPPAVAPEVATVTVQIAKTQNGHYTPATKTITMGGDPTTWKGRPELIHHEFAHHVHFERKIITFTSVAPEFSAAIKADLATLRELNTTTGGGLETFVAPTTIRNKYGYTLESFAHSMEQRTAVARLADAIGGASKGSLGYGHSKAYYKRTNGGAMELFAQAYSAIVTQDKVFMEMFPNVVDFIMKELGL